MEAEHTVKNLTTGKQSKLTHKALANIILQDEKKQLTAKQPKGNGKTAALSQGVLDL